MLEGILRESIDKKALKSLRRDGYLIANIYGKGFDNVHAAFKENEFIKEVRRKENLIFPVKVNGEVYNVTIQEYQRDPVANKILHVDLRIAAQGVVAKYFVPVVVSGIAKGIKDKGVLVQSKRRLRVKCAPEFLPNSFTLDVSDLEVGQTLLVRDVKLPSNVQIVDAQRVAVVGVVKAK
ncbi:MAG: 50S ribosomal protein L25/general stress protein Ctc [Campylobacteraceae bacterium]|jgi:large subunit ribosomal protein L25|nr:50S ribosomal protein L25/general stress protein Ctc [Campylobacteraceae bacterium]